MLSDYGVFEIKTLDKRTSIELSETGQAKLCDFNNYGWLIWFTSHWNSKMRVVTWKLLKKIVSFQLLQCHGTLIETAIQTAIEPWELYGVKICALTFLEKACSILMENESIDQENSNLSLITNIVSRSSFLSRTKSILQDD